MNLIPLTRREARAFIARVHRHNKPPSVAIFQIGLEDNGKLVGVAMAARPLARHLCDGTTLEISRVATDGSRNACSMLYGACLRAAWALGYRRCVTYTLEAESGASLRASGWKQDAVCQERVGRGWGTRPSSRSQPLDLFGEKPVPSGPRLRWVVEKP